MGNWTRKDGTGFQPRRSPSSMKAQFPAETFIDGSGIAQDSLNWLYADANGKTLHVSKVPLKYWTPDGAGSVREMTAPEKAVVDALQATVVTNANRAGAVEKPVLVDVDGVSARGLIELLNKRDNFLVNRVIELQGALTAMKATSGGAQNTRDAIPGSWLATNTRTKAAAITDYTDDINAGKQDT